MVEERKITIGENEIQQTNRLVICFTSSISQISDIYLIQDSSFTYLGFISKDKRAPANP